MKKQLKCYIYNRVSTSMQIDGYSLDAQKSRMKAFCEFNDYELENMKMLASPVNQ